MENNDRAVAATTRAALISQEELYWCGATNDRLHGYCATFLGEDPRKWTVAQINTVCLALPADRKEYTRIRLIAALQEYQARVAAQK